MKLFKLIILLCFGSSLCAQQNTLLLEDNTRLYFETTGAGQALIFIPGWTMTGKFFENQKSDFLEDFQFITYDPRGQGRSDKTDLKNTYADHADDLRQLILKMELDNVVLVGWSSGCMTMYEYLEKYGEDRIDKLVFIDEPPKWVGDPSTEWVYGSFDDYRSSLKGMISEPADPNGIIDWMLSKPVDEATRKWMVEEMSMTPRHIALKLYIDGLIADHISTLDNITIPALFMVRNSWFEEVKEWLDKRNAEFETVGIDSHAMFWESPDRFNFMLASFLKE